MTHNADLAPPENIYEPFKPDINVIEVFLLVIAVYSVAARPFISGQPSSVETLLGPEWGIVWFIGLTLGGMVALTGVFWRGRGIVAIAIQETGYILFSILSLARVVALVAIGEVAQTPVIMMFVIASIARVVQLELRVRRALKSGRSNWFKGKWPRWER